MLPLFALLLFALIGIGALVVDGGIAFTEQARLDAAAESLALEWSYARALPAASDSSECTQYALGSAERETCLRGDFLAPLVESLGLVETSDADGLSDSPRALDGMPIAAQGARLGRLTTAGVFAPAADDVLRLTRSTPLLLGWAALPATTAGDPPLDFDAIQAARAHDGMAPSLPGAGLRLRGFSVEGRARLADVGIPALRIGALLPGQPDVAGGIGIAWRLDALDVLASTLGDPARERTIDLATSATRAGHRIQLGALEVGCSFDPGNTPLHVGATLTPPDSLPLPVPARAALAYFPVVEDCASPILGFIEVAYDPSDPSLPASSTTRIELRRSDGRALHRNASARLTSSVAANAAAAVFDGPGIALLLRADAAWAPLVVRLPRLAEAS